MKIKNTILLAAICLLNIQNIHAQAWNLSGNAGTNVTDNFIGTSDNKPLKIRTNNVVRMTFATSGRVGIGIASPEGKVHIKGNSNVSQLIIDGSAIQTNEQPLIRLRKSTGVELMHIHSDDSTNIFIGINAGRMNDTAALSWDGTRNTFIGCRAGASNFHGSQNTAVGGFALASNTNGSYNTAIGLGALTSNTNGGTNTAVGMATMEYNTTGQGNTGCGFRVLNQNSTGQSNTGIGYQALWYNNGDRNSAFGYEVLLNNSSGAYNTAGGYNSMRQNTSGSINTAYGHFALYSNTTGNWNTATGHQALFANNGTGNTADGLNALYNNTSGNYNTASGYQSLFLNTSGSYNVAMGTNTNYYNNGTYNTAIGTDAGCNNGTGPSNFSAFGHNAGHIGSNSNTIEFGDMSVSWIGGNVGWWTSSDRRIKDNIQSNVPGLAFINKLNPVTYKLNIHKQSEICGIVDSNEWEGKYDIEKITQTGFLAQEVEQAAAAVDYDFSGVQAPHGNGKLYSIQYSAFVVPLVKAVQELNEQNTELKSEIVILREELKTMKAGQVKTVEQQSSILFQNSPNPFHETTIIKYIIPESAQHTEIKIYTANGNEITSIPVSSKGFGQTEISSKTLSVGTYTYILLIDGRIADTKQMVLTK